MQLGCRGESMKRMRGEVRDGEIDDDDDYGDGGNREGEEEEEEA